MSGLPIVNENLKVSVGAARRGVDSANGAQRARARASAAKRIVSPPVI
jgi:hypothetical protein